MRKAIVVTALVSLLVMPVMVSANDSHGGRASSNDSHGGKTLANDSHGGRMLANDSHGGRTLANDSHGGKSSFPEMVRQNDSHGGVIRSEVSVLDRELSLTWQSLLLLLNRLGLFSLVIP